MLSMHGELCGCGCMYMYVCVFQVNRQIVLQLYRMVHGFTSSGLLTQQYNYFCEAAGIGEMSQGYIRSSECIIFH